MSLMIIRFTNILNTFRSYGVLLWEIVTYGEIPLKNMSNSEILDMAERKVLKHLRWFERNLTILM